MKTTKEHCRKNHGITLIALVITIIVMLILVAVTITMAVNGGLFDYASRAGTKTNEAVKAEQELGSGRIKIGGIWYDSPQDYVDGKPSANQGEGTGNEGDAGENEGGTTGGENPEQPQQPNTPDEDVLTVADLVEGEYINYIDKNGNKIKCIVLYNSDYGVQVVATEPVEQITLGGTSIEEVIESYNGAIQTLNEAANEYLNTKYASSARSIGSVPNNPSYEPEGFYEGDSVYDAQLDGLIKNGDDNYYTDLEQLPTWYVPEAQAPFSFDGECWLASRFLVPGYFTTPYEFGLYYYAVSTGVRGDNVHYYDGKQILAYAYGFEEEASWGSYYSETKGLLPVFTLISDLEIEGLGTSVYPYEFK